jgi:thioredoxin
VVPLYTVAVAHTLAGNEKMRYATKEKWSFYKKESAMSQVVHGSDDKFEEMVINSDVPVLVDFWAPWCGPCLVVGPILEQMAETYAGRVKVVKMNVDEETRIAGSMGVSSIPTIVLYQGGEPRKILVGARPKAEFERLLDAILAE